DELLERGPKRRSIVEADRFPRALRHQNSGRDTRIEESRSAARSNENRTRFVENSPRIVVVGERPGEQAAGHPLPELAQAHNAPFGRAPRDDRAMDGPYRSACDPGRGLLGFAQGLIGAGLISTKRAAALEDENDLFVGTGHALPLPHVCGRREPALSLTRQKRRRSRKMRAGRSRSLFAPGCCADFAVDGPHLRRSCFVVVRREAERTRTSRVSESRGERQADSTVLQHQPLEGHSEAKALLATRRAEAIKG